MEQVIMSVLQSVQDIQLMDGGITLMEMVVGGLAFKGLDVTLKSLGARLHGVEISIKLKDDTPPKAPEKDAEALND